MYFLSENAIMQKTFFLIIWKDFQIPPRDNKAKKSTTRKQEEQKQEEQKQNSKKSKKKNLLFSYKKAKLSDIVLS